MRVIRECDWDHHKSIDFKRNGRDDGASLRMVDASQGRGNDSGRPALRSVLSMRFKIA